MTRHIFAFLALLSGLAAISHPVHAHLAEASAACDASVDVQGGAAVTADHGGIKSASEEQTKRDARQPEVAPAHLPELLPLPVLMGVDRAYE